MTDGKRRQGPAPRHTLPPVAARLAPPRPATLRWDGRSVRGVAARTPLDASAYPIYFAPVRSKSADLRDLLRERAAIVRRERQRAGFMYKSYETFVLAYGRDYDPKPLDRHERAHVHQMLHEYRAFWRRGFEYNHCFANAQRLIPFDTSRKVVYVEGFVWAYGDRLPPVHHGWLSLHGKVIDLTAPTRAIARKPPPEPPQLHGDFEGRAYLGVPFLRPYLRERSNGLIGWGSLLDDEKSGYRLLAFGGDGAVRGRKRTQDPSRS